jgi:hypothetical protein
MKISNIIRCAVFTVLATGMAFAADITGKWTGEFAGPDGGGGMTVAYTFKQEGAKLTGTSEGPGGEMQIKDGKVDGDKVVFSISFDGGGGEMKIVHEGTIKGDEITLKIKMGAGGEGPGGELKLKRAK